LIHISTTDQCARATMSRNPINEEILSLGNQLRKGMDSLTIMDPGRLRDRKLGSQWEGGARHIRSRVG
jgi:hypothetical protein